MNAAALRCAAAIRRVGCPVVLLRDGDRLPFWASVQPRRSEEEPEGSPLGMGCAVHMTLYTPLDISLSLRSGDRVECAGARYRVLRTADFQLRGEPVYRWAALRRETGPAAEGVAEGE